jgi:hypothetical protein
MTSPNTDAPVADVAGPKLLSEIVTIITLVGSALVVVFGQDWGIRAHAQDVASAAVVILPAALGLARALKHRGAMAANAQTATAQLYTTGPGVTTAVPDPSPSPGVYTTPGVPGWSANAPTTTYTGSAVNVPADAYPDVPPVPADAAPVVEVAPVVAP